MKKSSKKTIDFLKNYSVSLGKSNYKKHIENINSMLKNNEIEPIKIYK